jgi:hypothetical protein
MSDPAAQRGRRGFAPFAVFLVILFVGLGVVDIWWHSSTGTWIPSLSSTPEGVLSEGTGPRLSPLTPSSETQQPVAAPLTAPPVATNPVPQDVPTSLTVRRGAQVIIPASHVDPFTENGDITPPGNGPIWLDNVGSKVGVGMGTAWIIGHTELGNTAMPFNNIGNVLPGDLVDVTVGNNGPTVTFQVDSVGPPPNVPGHQGEIQLTNEPNLLKLVTCTLAGDANIMVTAHPVSL